MASAKSEEEQRSVLSAPLPRVDEGQRADIPDHVYEMNRPTTPRRRRRPREGRSDDPSTAETVSEAPQPSLPDRITRTALSGTLGVLKQVGGLTLSTTGALVAPPLHVTKTILLPQIWAAFVDFLASNSPPRLQHWFRIVQTSIYHVGNTLLNTNPGRTARLRWLRVWNDGVDCLSSAPARQWIIDLSSTLIKGADLLASDPAHAFFEQLTITICRGIDVIASGRTKLLVHDTRAAMAALTDVWSDPATTTALAEVTAYVCHALEMEEAAKQQHDSHGRRHKYANMAEQQRDTLVENNSEGHRHRMTVEEAILSSLGATDGDDDEDHVSRSTDWDGASSIRQQLDGTDGTKDDFVEQAREEVDLDYLRDGIEQRAERLRHQSEFPEQPDVEELEGDTKQAPAASRQRNRVTVETVENENGDDTDCDEKVELPTHLRATNPGRLEGESNLEHFDRVVQEILVQQRSQRLHVSAAASTVASVRRSSPSQDRKGKIASHFEKKLHQPARGRRSRCNTMMLAIAGLLSATICTLWFALGCFGLYQSYAMVLQPKLFPTSVRSSPRENEIVIRVVKEVVHKSADGNVLQRGRFLGNENDDELNTKIVECVANLYN